MQRLPVIEDKKRMAGMLSGGDTSRAATRELFGGLLAALSSHHS
jgi:hypothetical protein